MPKIQKKRNPQDATLRNIRAAKRREQHTERRLARLERRILDLTALCNITSRQCKILTDVVSQLQGEPKR